MDPRTPVVVGVGHVTNRRERIVEPLDLMEEATRRAAEDACAPVLDAVRSVQVVNLLSWNYPNPAQSLADRLGLPDGECVYSTVGGNSPQYLMGRICDQISSGGIDAVLMAGAEAFDSARQARAQGIQVSRGDRNTPTTATVVGDARNALGPADMTARLFAPASIYPLYESALAAEAGRTLDEQREWLGGLMAAFTRVAASHPDHAWFPEERSAAEIAALGPDNRYICEPYPKLMNAIMQVDQGTAVVVMSSQAAEAAGVPRDRWVFPWASADATDVFVTSQRPSMTTSPGIRLAGQSALQAAGIGIDDVALIDLYSCFPCAVQIGAAELGIGLDDPRGLTLTGGLPYFGGAGNNYVSHSIVVAAQRLRDSAGAFALVTGIGWYITKHAVGIYATAPPPAGWAHPDTSREQARIDASAVELASDTEAEATVEAVSIQHDRIAGPNHAPVFARLADGRRVVASPADPAIPGMLSGTAVVGRKVRIRRSDSGPVYEL